MNVYIAAPLFSDGERLFNQALSDAVEKTCTVYLPQRDGPLVQQLVRGGVPAHDASRLAYVSDVNALKSCDILIAILDGRALDEGVCIEMGFAKALGKLIIGMKTDVRIVLPWGNNPLVEGCVDAWARSIEDVLDYVTRGVGSCTQQRQALSETGDQSTNLPL